MNVNIPYLQMTKRKNEQSCFKSRLEMVRLVRFRTVSDKFLYMTGKRIKFLIDMYGSWRLTVPWLWRIPPVYDLFWCLFGFLLFLVFCFFSFFFLVSSFWPGSNCAAGDADVFCCCFFLSLWWEEKQKRQRPIVVIDLLKPPQVIRMTMLVVEKSVPIFAP